MCRDDNKRSMIEITSYYILYFYFKNLYQKEILCVLSVSWNLPCLKVSRTSRFTLVRSRLTHIFFTIFFTTTKIVVVAFEDISAIKFCWRHNHWNWFPLQQFHVAEDEYLLPSRPIVIVTADLLNKNNSN